MAIIVINGKTYDSDILTKEARDKILMAQVFDKRINELKNDQVMAQIALNTVVLHSIIRILLQRQNVEMIKE